MSKSKDSGHFGDAKLDTLHDIQKNTTEGGACLTGHSADFKDFKNKVSCNYRYQGHEQADSNGDIKSRLHSYNDNLPERRIETSAYQAKKGGMTPDRYCAHLAIPEPGDWDVRGPLKSVRRRTFDKSKVRIPAGYNFTQDTWPYWNNAHHLIPKGTLEKKILEQEYKVSNIMQKALLKAKYNVNHKRNMLMIPQDREVAALLNLPRHIQLKDDDAPSLAASCTDHPIYSAMVKEVEMGLNKIIDDYKSICDGAKPKPGEEHEIPDVDLDKSKLEDLSELLLQMHLNWGKPGGTGPSLDKKATQVLKKIGRL
ncbi:AHH domain-containing protein [Pyxidicoccus sp. MSG2]|uniref:AHH domain-containing protein n=1 Tax=Pyxidicoccus sp. MSG2 TaxID=2996790 RepID=UPI00226EAA19|nr:AHH domain-containing protein [Pyxidicoccus sp. MSG2]MCY1016936.1 AHH domain-containing protein [Pyxidicoccus sp. MSG2]